MNATIDRTDNKALPVTPVAPEALSAFAGELPLEMILLEMRRFYGAGEDPRASAGLDYQQLCDTWIRSLDTALAGLETRHAQ